jgi:hypothetical protein
MVIDVEGGAYELSRPSVRHGRHPAPTMVLLSILVLALLSGPNLLRTTTLTLAWQIPTSTRFFWLTPSTVYTLDDLGGGTVALDAHEPGNQRIVWSLPLNGPLAQAYAAANPLFTSDMPPSSAAGVRTIITGSNATATYPAAAMPLVYLTDDLVITIDRDLAVSPATGETNNGLQWTHRVTARSLATRAVVWSRPLAPGTRWSLPGVVSGTAGIVGLPAGSTWMATWSVDGTVDVWDLETGATRASRLVGAMDPHTFATALPDAVLLSRPADDGTTLLSAYDTQTLRPLWTITPPLDAAEPISCDPDLCLVSHRATWIVDPHTNVVTARILGTLVRPGPAGEAVVAPYNQNTSVVDTETGVDHPLEQVWRMVDATAYVPHAVVVQIYPLGRANLGLLDVANASVTTLGPTDQWSTYYSCLATDATVACDDGNVLTVWRRAT